MSLLSKFFTVSDAVAGRLGLLDRPFSAARLIAKARKATRLEDFGNEEFQAPLECLLTACHREADLTLFGRLATEWDVVRFLGNLLTFRDRERRDPGILDEAIERPIFICGLPRSGTTFFHRLLLLDPANEAPRVFQTIHPYPPNAPAKDQRVTAVDRQLRMFEHFAPDFRGMHPIQASSPQECSEVTAHVFASLRFDTNYNIPSYRSWLDDHGHVSAYRFHKRFLQHLQHQTGPRRWILKCPDHVFALDAIRAVYPDAGIVFVHRDPLKVLASNARLTEVLREPFMHTIDRAALGRQESVRWHDGATRMVHAATATDCGGDIFHVRHTDLIRDPAGTVAAFYRHFGLALDEDVLPRVRASNDEVPRGGYSMRSHRLEDHGLSPEAERRKFLRYTDTFGIELEAGGGVKAVSRPDTAPVAREPERTLRS